MVVPTELEGLNVLDLGSGSGRDCYLLAQLVGEKGSVTGVDMTDEQLEVANRHLDFHKDAFGYEQSNVRFLKGNIEKMAELDLASNSFDLIISNCVINLATDKKQVLADAYRILKQGGEMYFSDVYCDRRVPEELQKDEVLYGECLSGALYWNDFLSLAKEVGFIDPRLVESSEISIENPKLKERLGKLKFFSVTYRLFKEDRLESDCEDYGQAVRYKGTLLEDKDKFVLDNGHIFETDRIYPVCGNSYLILNATRFQKHSDFFGHFSTHYGIFEGCGTNMPFSTTIASAAEAGSEEGASCC